MQLSVSRPGYDDLEEINTLIVTAKKSWGYSDEQIAHWLPELLATNERLNQQEFWLARNTEEEAVYVYSISARGHDIYELEDCWIAPRFKGKGYGRLLFGHLRKQLVKKNAQKLVIVSDPNAEGFYQRMGAVTIGTKQSSIPGRVLPVLELDLD